MLSKTLEYKYTIYGWREFKNLYGLYRQKMGAGEWGILPKIVGITAHTHISIEEYYSFWVKMSTSGLGQRSIYKSDILFVRNNTSVGRTQRTPEKNLIIAFATSSFISTCRGT